MDFDPNDYEDKGNGGGGNFLPAGKHIVRVIDHELGESSGGLAQVMVDFEAKDGRTRKAWLIAEGKAGFQLAALFRACGWTSKVNLSASGVIKKAIYGKDIEIVVAEDTYQGKTSLKVKYINKAPESDNEPRNESRGGGWGGESRGGGYGQRSAPPPDDLPPPTDEDIPF